MKPRLVSLALAVPVFAAVALLLASELACNAEPSSTPPPCCPQCGCHDGLIPVCHPYWTTKKETKYHYCCKCEPICIPDQWPCCSKSGCDSGNGNDSNCCNDVGDCDGGKCNCLIIAQHRLVKFPYTVETPVCKCKIEWVCPRCGCNCSDPAENDSTRTNVSASAPLPAPDKSASANPTGPAIRDIYSASDDAIGLRIPK